ncbi:MAG: ATP-binding protein [Planctomycetota bacterium]
MANLVVLNGLRNGTVVSIDGELLIGRGPAAGLRLPDQLVSGSHAAVRRGEGGYQLFDLASTNGTYLNDARVEHGASLRFGDVLRFGNTRVLFSEARVDEEDQEADLGGSDVVNALLDDDDDDLPQVLLIGREETEVLLGDSGTFKSGVMPAVDAVQRDLSRAESVEDLLLRLAAAFLRATAAERALVAVRGDDEQPRIALRAKPDPKRGVAMMEAADFSVRADLLELGLTHRGAVMAHATQHELHTEEDDTGVAEVVPGTPPLAMCLALPSAAGIVGAIYLHGVRTVLTRDDLRLLMLLATLAGANLRSAQLLQRAQAREQELADLQRRLLDAPGAGVPSDRPLARAVADLPDAIVILTLEGQVTAWNRGAVALYGYAPDDVVGHTLPTVPDDRGAELERVLGAVAAGRTLTLRTVRLSSDGREVPIEASYAPLPGPAGEVVGAVEIARDLGPRRREEERLRSLEREASFHELAATLAHELGNPLSNLRSGVEWLLARPRSELELRESLTTLRDEIDRLHRLTRQTLDLARWSPPQPEDVVVEELLDYVAHAHARRAEELGVSIELPRVGRTVLRADADQLKQALYNLVDNALGALPEGGRIELGCEVEGEEVVLLVGDNGPGIPEDIRARLFELFVGRRTGGSGVGLAVVRRIAQLHGGRVGFETSPAGTTFFLRLPRQFEEVS